MGKTPGQSYPQSSQQSNVGQRNLGPDPEQHRDIAWAIDLHGSLTGPEISEFLLHGHANSRSCELWSQNQVRIPVLPLICLMTLLLFQAEFSHLYTTWITSQIMNVWGNYNEPVGTPLRVHVSSVHPVCKWWIFQQCCTRPPFRSSNSEFHPEASD